MIDKIFELGLRNSISFYPDEFVTIKEALEGKNYVTISGSYKHYFDKTELEKLSSKIPIYMWGLVRIPFVIVKTLNVGEYLINGSDWDKKAINILLNKQEFSVCLYTGDVERLIKEFKSLIFITLSPIESAPIEDDENDYY
ncbi:DUF61 family protein [Sulfolobaceae archaeon RB850M]